MTTLPPDHQLSQLPDVKLVLSLRELKVELLPNHARERLSCTLAIDASLLQNFDVVEDGVWVGSGKRKPAYYILPGSKSEVMVTFYAFSCEDRNKLQKYGRSQLQTWQLLGEDRACRAVVRNIANTETLGTMQIRLLPKRTEDGHQTSTSKPHQEPTLENIRRSLVALEGHKSISPHTYHIAHTYMEALYVYMRKHFTALIRQAAKRHALDSHRRPVDHMDLRGNVMEDMLIQSITQLQFTEQCLQDAVLRAKYGSRLHDIASSILDSVARATALICSFANTYFEWNYSMLESVAGEVARGFYRWHRDLLHGRTRLVLLRNGRVDTPPEKREDLLRFLFHAALAESRDDDDWLAKSYTAVLSCAREKHAQSILYMIRDEFDRAPDARRRDALRRLLVHICQEADVLPRFLERSAREVTLPGGAVYEPESSTADPTGEGSYARVYEGRMNVKDEPQQRIVAIKCLKFVAGHTEQDRRAKKQQMYLEIIYTWTLRHRHIIPLLGISHFFGPVSLITPWMPNGTVRDCLAKLKKEASPEVPIVNHCHSWIAGVASGLAYLHGEGAVHGDLRGTNVLVDHLYQAVIADFGLALFASGHSRNYASRRTGNSGWTAPELFDMNGTTSRPTTHSDVYSFAIVCVEIYLGRTPFVDDDSSLSFCRRVLQGRRPERPEVPVCLSEYGDGALMPDSLWRLVTECWDGNMDRRPTAREVDGQLAAMFGRGPATATDDPQDLASEIAARLHVDSAP